MTSNVATLQQNKSGFDLAPQNIDQAMQLAKMISQSQLCPKEYKGKPEDTLVAMMQGHEIGLNPLQSIQNIAVINGRPSIWGDAMIGLVQNHPKFGGIEESFDEQSMTATCTVWRKGGSKHSQKFTKAMAERAGLWGKQGPWTQHPERMMAMRARGFALRNQFADALLGLISREEAIDMDVEEYEVVEDKKEPSLPACDEQRFNTNFPKHTKMIADGKKTAEDIIGFLSAKYTLTEEQKQAYRDFEAEVKGDKS